MPRVLVTGGAGFIGHHLSRFLVKKKYQVVVVDNLKTGKKEGLDKRIVFIKEDILRVRKLESVYEKYKPDFVIHLAALTSKKASDSGLVTKVNFQGTSNIAELSAKYKVKKLVFASSAAIYSPVNPYGKSKLLAEKTLKDNFAILRFSNVYGPGQRSDNEGGVVSIFCQALKKGQPLFINGDGYQTRDFIYVDDVVRAIYKAMKFQNNITLNVSTSKETSILNLVSLLENVSDKKAKIQFRKLVLLEIKNSRLDYKKTKKVLNWQPQVNLESGLKRVCGKV